MTLYQELLAAGVKLGHYDDDLYAQVTPTSSAIVERYPHQNNVKIVIPKNVAGMKFYEIPFVYDPYWERKSPSNSRK